MTHFRVSSATAGIALGLTGLLIASCGGITKSDTDGGGSESIMDLEEVFNGFGQLVPHSIRKLDSNGNPTLEIVQIRSQQDLIDNLTETNPVQPVPKFPQTAVLPTGAPGNQFLAARFTQPIFQFSALDRSPGSQANSNLTGVVSVVAIDPISGTSLPVIGRAFINGQTIGREIDPDTGQLPLERWVELSADGIPENTVPDGLGFPGVQSFFVGASQLINKNTLVFIPDADGKLETYETFPKGFVIRMRVTTGLEARNGKMLKRPVLGSTVVGVDDLTPEVIVTPPPLQQPLITPGNGDLDVDPLTTIKIQFTEPVQPFNVGALAGAGPPRLSSAIKMGFGPEVSRTDMPMTVRPVSVYDLSVYELIPAFHFPGAGPEFQQCGTFSRVDIGVNAAQIVDLAANPDPNEPGNLVGNRNQLATSTFFVTGEGPGLVNAPVAPDTIYLSRSGANPGISVLDLNGFGQSTGNPTFVEWTEGIPKPEHTNFPNNPNLRFHSGLRPVITAGTCTIDGGSAGVFTLTRDSTLNDQVVRPPVVADATDMMLGHALDVTFNNAQFPFGCQAGGGDICTPNGFKYINYQQGGPNTLGPLQPGGFSNAFGVLPGEENFISWAPHPNPPGLSFPPLCVSPFLLGDEPTQINHAVPGLPGQPNQFKQQFLVPGDPFGDPINIPRKPPSGLLTPELNVHFSGPTQGQKDPAGCLSHMYRQQIGHFLYVLDRERQEVAVLNSNRMTVIDRIVVADPTSFAMSPNLDVLAVTNQSSDSVTFIDINPKSATFHSIIKTIQVGKGPRGIAWQPGNEDILVCNEVDSSMSLVSGWSLEVRKTVSSQLIKPFDVVTFPRQRVHSFARNTYYAFVLNRNGRVAVFESGPNGVNGWGYDDIIGIAPFEFLKPKTLQVDPTNEHPTAWIVHEGALDPQTKEPGPLNFGALSKLFIESSHLGQIFLDLNSVLSPGFRDMGLNVNVSVGEDVVSLSGIPVDIAFDNQRNLGGMPNVFDAYSAGAPLPANGKGLIRDEPLWVNADRNVSAPQFMFAAVPNALGGFGVVDVFEIGSAGVPRRDTNAFESGIQSIQVPNVVGLMDYWRQ